MSDRLVISGEEAITMADIAMHAVRTETSFESSKRDLEEMSPELRARVFRALEEQQGKGMFHDSIEDEAAYAATLAEIDAQAWARIDERGVRYARTAFFWVEKRALVQETIGIRWYSLAEMNPKYWFHPG